MTASDSRTAPTTRPAAITGLIAAVISVAFTAFWAVQLITLRGGDRFVMVATLLAFAIVVWIWVALAVISLVLARRSGSRAPGVRVPAYIAFGATVVCAIFAVITLFQ